MKGFGRRYWIILCALLAVALLSATPSMASETTCTISFDLGGSSLGNFEQYVEMGECVMKPAAIIADGRIASEWYENDERYMFDFNTPIIGNITLHAIWTEVNPEIDAANAIVYGNGFPLYISGDSLYTYVCVGGYDDEGGMRILSYISSGSPYTIFGGGRNCELHGDTRIHMKSGKVGKIYGGSQLGSISGTTSVEMSGGVADYVYGGGAFVASNSSVTISGDAHVLHDVYDGGELAQAYTDIDGSVEMSGGVVDGNVYGGGSLANVVLNSTVSGGSGAGQIPLKNPVASAAGTSVQLSIDLNGAAWTDHADAIFALHQNGLKICALSDAPGDIKNVLQGGVTADGTYDLFINGFDSGADITVTGGVAAPSSVALLSVAFDKGGASGDAPKTQYIIYGKSVTEPPADSYTLIVPSKRIAAWYDASPDDPWTFGNNNVEKPLTLHPNWEIDLPWKIQNAQPGGTITLDADYTNETQLNSSLYLYEDLTIDLNGHTVDCGANCIKVLAGKLTITDTNAASPQPGSITSQYYGGTVDIHAGASFQLDGGKIVNTNQFYFAIDNGGNASITGGTCIGGKSSFSIVNNENATMNITGGEIGNAETDYGVSSHGRLTVGGGRIYGLEQPIFISPTGNVTITGAPIISVGVRGSILTSVRIDGAGYTGSQIIYVNCEDLKWPKAGVIVVNGSTDTGKWSLGDDNAEYMELVSDGTNLVTSLKPYEGGCAIWKDGDAAASVTLDRLYNAIDWLNDASNAKSGDSFTVYCREDMPGEAFITLHTNASHVTLTSEAGHIYSVKLYSPLQIGDPGVQNVCNTTLTLANITLDGCFYYNEESNYKALIMKNANSTGTLTVGAGASVNVPEILDTHAIYNNSTANVIIAGGTLTSYNKAAFINASTGNIEITGGVLFSPVAMDNAQGALTISGAPQITGTVKTSLPVSDDGYAGSAVITIQNDGLDANPMSGQTIVTGSTDASKWKLQSTYLTLAADSDANSLVTKFVDRFVVSKDGEQTTTMYTTLGDAFDFIARQAGDGAYTVTLKTEDDATAIRQSTTLNVPGKIVTLTCEGTGTPIRIISVDHGLDVVNGALTLQNMVLTSAVANTVSVYSGASLTVGDQATVKSTGSRQVIANNSGTITVYGTVTMEGNKSAISNMGAGSIAVAGGTVTSAGDSAIICYANYTGSVTISEGSTVYGGGYHAIVIQGGPVGSRALEITGGTVQSLNRVAISIDAAAKGDVYLSGGSILGNGYGVVNSGSGTIIVSGAPSLSHPIDTATAIQDAGYTGTTPITVRQRNAADGQVVVLGGAANASRWKIEDSGMVLLPSGSNLIARQLYSVSLVNEYGSTLALQTSADGISYTDYTEPIVLLKGGDLYVKATTAEGYSLVEWADGITDNPYHIVNIDADVSFTPVVALNTYTVTLTDNDAGITGFETSADGETYAAYTAPVSVNHGSTLYVKALIANGHTFVKWADGRTANPLKMENIVEAVSYTPTSTPNRTVTVLHGLGSGTSIAGKPVDIVAVLPDINQRFLSWSGADALTFTVGSAQTSHAVFVTPDTDVNLTAMFYTPSADKTLVLPDSVIAINEEAFVNGAFEEVICPEGMRTIGARAFAQCSSLAHIVLPDTVNAIAADAFEGCAGISIICEKNSYAMTYAVDHDIDYQLFD